MTGQQLKNSILQMAVQGKLVPQDPNDEPASVLLERIRKEKEQLIKEGKIKKEKNPSYIFKGADNLPYEKVGKNEPVCIAEEVPFEIPDSWEWARLGTILHKLSDGTHSTPKYVDNGVPFISVKDISSGFLDFSSCKYISMSEHAYLYSRCNAEYGDILLTKVGTTGIPVIVDTNEQFSLFVSVALLKFNQQLLCNKFLIHLINSPLVQKQAAENTKGVGNKNWVMRDIANTLIVIPPLKEQYRIVSEIQKYDGLLCEYTKKENELSDLNDGFPELLKKSILQEAFQGKLIPQNPNDEPASVLLERIRKEKEQLIKERKIKRDRHYSFIFKKNNAYYEKRGEKIVCIDDEIPFDIPNTWQWERWGNISQNIQYGYNAPAKAEGKIKMVRISDIHNNTVQWNTVPFCDIANENIGTYLLKPNDILFARTGGTVGKSYLVTETVEDAIYAGYLIRTRYSDELVPKYLKYFMESELYWSQLHSGTIATAQPNCNGQTLSKMLLPIPPRAEQERITKMIDILFEKI